MISEVILDPLPEGAEAVVLGGEALESLGVRPPCLLVIKLSEGSTIEGIQLQDNKSGKQVNLERREYVVSRHRAKEGESPTKTLVEWEVR